MLTVLMSIVGILLTILIVVGIHELGHFLVAKWSGIKVLRFSIGFGKTLWTCHDKSGTEYALSLIPLGGYVKMLGEEDEDFKPSEKHLTYQAQPFYKKILVIAAGPAMNMVLALVIYWVLFMVGFTSVAPVIGKIEPHSIAEAAGLKPQQEIISVDSKETHGWMNIIIYILARAGDKTSIAMKIKNPNLETTSDYNLNLTNWHMDDLRPDPLKSIGITPYDPIIPDVIGLVKDDSPAAIAGLQKGDQITAVNGAPTADWLALVDNFSEKPDTTLTFTIKRAGKIINLPVTIGAKRSLLFHKHGYLGMSPAFEWPKNLLHLNKYGPVDALGHAWSDVKMFTDMNFMVFGKMLTGKISLESLGGPITIFESAGTALNNGAMSFFSFLAFLSISIGIINILPIPGLDGGHLLFQTIEFIRGKPMSHRAQALLYRMGLILLVLVMVQALMDDILRL
jgi:regulator of sigma E protease